jgi:hypothetical protein
VKLITELCLAPWSRQIGGINKFPVTYSEGSVYSNTVKILNLASLSKCKPKVLFESVSYCTMSDFEVNRTHVVLCIVE